MFTVALKYKRVLPAVMAAGGLAGLYAGLTGVVRYSFGAPGLFTLPIFIGAPGNFRNALITAFISTVVSFVLTYLFGIVEDKKEETPEKNLVTNTALRSVVDGRAIPLSSVNDEVFASGSMGSGIAIIPKNGMISAPIDSTVTMTYPTKHAVGLTTDDGHEILIHIGINTVNLKGRGFKMDVKENQKVKAGDPLVEVDLDLIKKEGFDPTVIMVLLNSSKETIRVNDVKEDVTVDDLLMSY